jgi:hypothetical protein
LPVLFYNHDRPFTKKVKFYDYYNPVNLVEKPQAYVIPQGWWAVIDLLKLNHIKVERFKSDTVLNVVTYHIDNYNSAARPYEKHHKNYNVAVSTLKEKIKFLRGDYFIRLNQTANRYLIETLEPTGDDGFFTWNFFDAILQQKEGYSPYRWDSIAAKLLENDPELNSKFRQKKETDTSFAKNANAQLDFIYKNSRYYEAAHLRYPVYRIEN